MPDWPQLRRIVPKAHGEEISCGYDLPVVIGLIVHPKARGPEKAEARGLASPSPLQLRCSWGGISGNYGLGGKISLYLLDCVEGVES